MKGKGRAGQNPQATVIERATDLSAFRFIVVAVALIIVTVVAYWGVWNHDFINFDDTPYVTENRHVKGGLSWDGIEWAFTSFHASNWHPVTWLSHMLDVSLFGMWAGGHHLTNLLFHLLNTLMLFAFLRFATRRLWPGAVVAALFAIHPLHVESVAWIAERKDVLSTFFWLATMWAYLLYVHKPGLLRYLGVISLYAIGLMAKPMLVTLPLVLFLLDYWPIERFEVTIEARTLKISGENILRVLLEKAPLLAMAACSSAVTMVAQRTAMTKLDAADFGPRLTNTIISYGRYIFKMLWPADLAAFYSYVNEPQYLNAAIVFLLLAGVTIAVIHSGRTAKFLPVGWMWYVITLIPVVGIVRVGSQSHADRYTYIPLTGIFIIIAWAGERIVVRRPQLARLLATFVGIVLVGSACLTQWYVRHWKDSYTFALRAAGVSQSVRMVLVLASSQLERGEFEAALANLREAEKWAPDDAEVLSGFGQVMLRMGRFEEAATYCKKALAIEPKRREVWLNAGVAFHGLEQTRQAEEHLRKAIEIDPYWAKAYSQLGRVLAEAGRRDESMAVYQKAIELDPMLPECHYNMGILQMHGGDFESAAARFRMRIAIEPDASSWSNLGGCMVAMKRLEDAEAAYRESLKLDPGNAQTHYNLGVVLASLGRMEEAVSQVRRSIEMDPSDPEKLEYYSGLVDSRQ